MLDRGLARDHRRSLDDPHPARLVPRAPSLRRVPPRPRHPPCRAGRPPAAPRRTRRAGEAGLPGPSGPLRVPPDARWAWSSPPSSWRSCTGATAGPSTAAHRRCSCTSPAAPRSTSASAAGPARRRSAPATSPADRAPPVRPTPTGPPVPNRRPSRAPATTPRHRFRRSTRVIDLLRPLEPGRARPARRRASVRDSTTGDPGHLLAQGLHPADDAVPRQVRLLHLRPAAGPARVAVPRRPSEVLAHRPAGRRGRLPRGAVHARRAPRGALPGRRASGWPSTATPVHRRLPGRHVRSWCSTRPACSPTPTPAPSAPTSSPGSARCRPVAGDDDRVAQRRPRLPPGLARQGARAPPRHARGRRRAGDPVHHRHPRRHRRVPQPTASTRSRPSPSRTAATATCRR